MLSGENLGTNKPNANHKTMTINFIIKSSASPSKTIMKMYHPTYAKVYVRLRDGRRIDQTSSTNFLVSPVAWNSRLGILNAQRCPEELEWEKINDAIVELRRFLTRKYINETLRTRVGPHWLRDSLDEYFGIKGRHLFNDAFDQFLQVHDLSESRIQQYEVLRRLILRFAMYQKSSDDVRFAHNLDLREFDPKALTDLWTFAEKEYLIFKENPEYFNAFPDKRVPRPRGKNTINDLFKKFRTFVNWCVSSGIVQKNPFDNFKMGADLYGTPVYLTLEELRTIAEADFSSSPRLARQRDVFVFQCCVGCRVGDLQRFTKDDLVDGCLQYIPHKTIAKNPQTIVIPLNGTARAIAERYADSASDKLLPFISVQKYNEAIKEIFEKAGITRTVTVLDTVTRQQKKVKISEIASSHMARRTFAGNLYKKVKDPSLISSLTGHTDDSRNFSRYRSIDDDIKKELVELLD